MANEVDPFIGTWVLDPNQSQYQYGNPPVKGSYKISTKVDQYVFEMKWETQDGTEHEMSFQAMPDGVERPYYDDPAVADSIRLTRIDRLTLDSETRKGGDITARASRQINEEENTMKVVQTGKTPDGQQYTNITYYAKVQ